MTMCTKEDVQEIIHKELDTRLADFIRKSWYIIIGLAATSAGAWFALYYQVQANVIEMGRNDEHIRSLLELNQQEVDNLRADYKEDISDIKDDIRYIRENI